MQRFHNMIPPKYGDPVPLICLKCHKHFIGPNPSGLKLFDDLLKKKKRAKCLECGSYRVVQNPFVYF